MISMKEAVERAVRFAQDIFILETNQPILLEEVESGNVNGKEVWLVTLSIQRNLFPRTFKTFAVNNETGEVLSMKIRELAGVNG